MTVGSGHTIPLFGNGDGGEQKYIGQEFKDHISINYLLSKLDVTQSGRHSRPINEAEFFATSFADAFSKNVFALVYRRCDTRTEPAATPEHYWKALMKEAGRLKVAGLSPILLVDNQTRPDWLWDWRYSTIEPEYWRPTDLNVHYLENKCNGYVCNLNFIEVYEAPLRLGES